MQVDKLTVVQRYRADPHGARSSDEKYGREEAANQFAEWE
jgi:hypothetical protein